MSSISLDYPVSSLQENPRPNGQVLTPKRGGHDIPSAVRFPDHRWRHDLSLGLEVQGRYSAHPSAATRHRACHDLGPVTPIRGVIRHAFFGLLTFRIFRFGHTACSEASSTSQCKTTCSSPTHAGLRVQAWSNLPWPHGPSPFPRSSPSQRRYQPVTRHW